jgi:hypothetical protein
MKKIFSLAMVLILLIILVAIIASPASAGKPDGCTRIQDGVLTYSTGHYLGGQPLQVGYDIFGYNYQAHQFNGSYANSYLGKDGLPPYEGDTDAYLAANPTAAAKWYWPYRDVQLMMKWSDIWISNQDCNNDNKLDRGGPGGSNSAADGAWLTNHQRGTDENGNWTYYVKIVYPPGGVIDTSPADGIDDNTGGEIIWGSFIVLQRVSSGEGATNYAQPVGFGAYK